MVAFYFFYRRIATTMIYTYRYILLISLLFAHSIYTSAQSTRTLSGTIVDKDHRVVPDITITIASSTGEIETNSNQQGRFQVNVSNESISLLIKGNNIKPLQLKIGPGSKSEDLTIIIDYIIPSVHESLVISGSVVEPTINHHNEEVYKNTLFSRDDQLFHTLDAGINAGQHEGGGKSVEIRRFGFNLDHGGVSGGLKVLIDNVGQNQSTQGHGQGYLGQLKFLTPELVKEVDILNGPFRPEYGDFSGLGVVHIRLKEELQDQLVARIHAGSFNTYRTFLGISPKVKNANTLLAYESTRTDGPFHNPLKYKRDNLTGNYTHRLDNNQAVGVKLNLGRNDFFSSGQLPLDEIAAGRLHRFGFIDPDLGGRVRSGTLGTYYRREWESGRMLKVDGFLSRSLFDLYSNFTFYLNDPINGDGIQQHDSRLQQGANLQYLYPNRLFGKQGLLTLGANFHANQINVGLYPRVMRAPTGVTTKADVNVNNAAGYIHQSIDLLQGRLHLEGGLRYDYFAFNLEDRIDPNNTGRESAGNFQPKMSIAFHPSYRLPVTFYLNYGRGISSQDARGIMQYREGTKISTTDFYQFGTSHYLDRFSLSTSLFLIDRSNEQVYIPDDGSIELKGPSRSYGYEIKPSIKLAPYLTINGGLTQVMNAFYRGTSPRIYIDSAPHRVANIGLTLSGWKGYSGSLRYRHISSYRLDGETPHIRASGHDVLDFYMSKQLNRWMDLNLGLDNLTNKRYYETQNYFESRISPEAMAIHRIHATPGYPMTLTIGLTFRFFGKD
jgi:outer membrane receptor protein involved in Fe transport